MGIFDLSGFLYTPSVSNDIKGIFSDVGSTVSSVGHEVVGTAKDIIHGVFDDTGKIVSTVTGDIKETVVGAAKEAGGAVGSIGSSFSWPLAVVAGIVAIAVLAKK